MKKKILIADDDPDLVEILQDRLGLAGYETATAFEGIRVIELANKWSPDLILLDLKMPAGTGQLTLKSLRKRSETKTIPVIVLTALQGGTLEKEVRDEGADDFLQKPFDVNVLLQRIATLLQKGRTD